MTYSSSFTRAHRKEIFRRLARIVRGAAPAPLPSFNDLRARLHLFQQSYAGLQTIEVEKIVGTVDRSNDFDRDFLPRSPQTRERWERLERAFPSLGFPPISVYQINDVYFVIDGNHRVALAKQKGAEFIDAEVTEIDTDIATHAALGSVHHTKYTAAEAVADVPFVIYIPFGSEPITGQSYAP